VITPLAAIDIRRTNWSMMLVATTAG